MQQAAVVLICLVLLELIAAPLEQVVDSFAGELRLMLQLGRRGPEPPHHASALYFVT